MSEEEDSQRKFRVECEVEGNMSAQKLRDFIEDNSRMELTAYDPNKSQDKVDSRTEDCYPAVISALTSGTLVTFNESDPSTWGTDEFRVKWAKDGEAGLIGIQGEEYTVEQDDGELVLYDAEGEWPERMCTIQTIEVVGLE